MHHISQTLQDAFETQNVSVKDLMQLARMDLDSTAQALHVSKESIRRWIRTGDPNPTAIKLLSILAGYVPWENWNGWEVHGGYLFAPGQTRRGVKPWHIEQVSFVVDYNLTLQKELEQLRNQLPENTIPQGPPKLTLVK